jgi:hypothetical protein
VIDFRSTVIGKNEVFIEVSEAIQEVGLWQDFVEFGEMLISNLKSN